jgi:hypothetical protein
VSHSYEEQTRSAQESILHKVLVAKQHEAYGIFIEVVFLIDEKFSDV